MNPSTHQVYSKTITFQGDIIRTKIKFFYDELFRTHLQQYLLNTYQVKCQIQLLENQDIYLILTGIKKNVKTSRETITQLFESTRTKVYDNETIDQQLIYWARNITSDLMIQTIQEIMNSRNLFTIWSKTKMFSGFIEVIYFTLPGFNVTEQVLEDILHNDIAYIENIPLPQEKTRNFLKAIDEFIFNKKDRELIIICCKYPYKLDIKISLFGRKKLVKTTRKQLQTIINKHTVKIIQIKMNAEQQEHLLDDCNEQFKDIEDEYKDDSVKIRIKQKEFHSPQYLIEKIRERINEFMFERITYQFIKIGDNFQLTDLEYDELNRIVRNNYCRIEKLDNKTQIKTFAIPNAISSTSNTFNSIIQQSNEFCSLLPMRKVTISNGSIEIYLVNQTDSILRDVTVISSPAAANDESIQYLGDNGYYQFKSDRKYLFHRWSPPILKDSKKLAKSIEKFISSTLDSITSCFNNVERIAYLTTEWEELSQQKSIECLILTVKSELEIRKTNWQIIFIFKNTQTDFYREFYQILRNLQTEQDGYAQFSCALSSIFISVIASWKMYLKHCEKDVKNYFQTQISTHTILNDQVNLQKWNQHMINVLYKYCLHLSVLPKFILKNQYQLELFGSKEKVDKCIEKYHCMNIILEEILSYTFPPPIIPRSSLQQSNQDDSLTMNTSAKFNIYFSYSTHDQDISNQIFNCLIADGYRICQKQTQTQLENSDVVLVGFSEIYIESKRCMAELNHSKSIGKKIIPFVIRNLNENQDLWLNSLRLAELFYDLFEREIEIEFTDDFSLEYDRLLSILFQYTKPGVTGKVYSVKKALPKIEEQNPVKYEQNPFGSKSKALQQLTDEQINQLRIEYDRKVAKKLEDEKFSNEDADILYEQLSVVIEDLKSILDGRNPYPIESDEEYRGWRTDFVSQMDEKSPAHAYQLFTCIERWLNKFPNVIANNIAPFTPTKDINDAIFVIHRTDGDAAFEQNFEPFEFDEPLKYFGTVSYDRISLFYDNESHDNYQKLLQSTKPNDENDLEMEKNINDPETLSLYDDKDNNNENNDNEEIICKQKSPEEIEKLERLDDPNRIWKNTRNAQNFIEQKIKNIIEFRELCENFHK